MNKNKKRITLRSEYAYALDALHDQSISPDTREIYLHAHIHDESEDVEPGVDFRMAIRFIKNLHCLERAGRSNILIHMYSLGGNWSDGMAIYNSIAASQCRIIILAHNPPQSMASIILQAADRRVLAPDAWMMIHLGHAGFEGTSLEIKTAAKMNEVANKRMFEIYVARCADGIKFKGWRPKRIRDYLKKEISEQSDWWVEPQDVVELGLADGIFGEEGFESIAKIRK